MLYIIVIAIILVAIFVIEPMINKRPNLSNRLGEIIEKEESKHLKEDEQNKIVEEDIGEINVSVVELNDKLERVGLPFSANEFKIFKVVSFVVILGLLFLLLKNIIIASIFAILWLFVPGALLNFTLSRKEVALEEQLPSVLMKVKNAVQTGIAMENAISELSKSINEPLASEFRRVTAETRAKIRFTTALKNMKNRLKNDEINLFVAAVLTQRKTGGDATEILGVIIEEVTTRLKIKKELRTLTAQGRIAGFIVGGLPFILGAILHFISPEHMTLLFTTAIGQGMLVVGVLLQIIGIVMIFKILKIEF